MNKKHKLLLVDNEKEILENFEYDLQDLNIDITMANNAEEALDQLLNESFDCIITDIKMPGIDGITLANKLILKDIKTPLIFLTAHADAELINKVSNLKPLDIIHKPYEKEDLSYLIQEAFYLSDEFKKSA